MQLKFYRSIAPCHHHVLRWIGTSDPISGTIRQGFHIQTTTPVPGTQPVSHTWFKYLCHHAAQILLSTQLFRHHHHVLRWDWHFRSPLWYHQDSASIHTSTHTILVSKPVSQTWFGAIRQTCSSNSNVPIVPPPPPFAVRIGTSDPPSGTMTSHNQYTHTCSSQGRTLQTWVRGHNIHSNSTVPIVAPPCAAVGLALADPTLWYYET
jgi:hypothetical protein